MSSGYTYVIYNNTDRSQERLEKNSSMWAINILAYSCSEACDLVNTRHYNIFLQIILTKTLQRT